MKTIALFDFDGTITSKDTLFEIAKFSSSSSSYYLKIVFLLPVFVLMKVKILSKQSGKELFIRLFFGGKSETEFNQICQQFCSETLPHLIRPQSIDQIKAYKSENTPVYIVSASPKNWITPWADQYGIKVLATELIVSDQKVTGKISGINCNGIEKVNRIKESINLGDYERIIAYGDTKGDLPMLDIATHKNFKPFR